MARWEASILMFLRQTKSNEKHSSSIVFEKAKYQNFWFLISEITVIHLT